VPARPLIGLTLSGTSMLIVIEGVSAAGKSTRAARYAPAVLDEIAGPTPVSDVRAAARYWSERDCERWARGLELEREHGVACFDTDPLKIHYSWCLWQIGHGQREEWRAGVQAIRERLVERQIGFADQILFLEPPEHVVRSQKAHDLTRRRGKFEVHVRLHEPLRRWYQTLESLAPGRVVFNAHLAPHPFPVEKRADRYSVDLFDAFMNGMDRGAG
jgi:hypothetical protein